MKFNRIAMAVALAAALTSHAQAGIVSGSLLGGMYSAEKPTGAKFDDGFFYGASAGYQFVPQFALEAEYGKGGDTGMVSANALFPVGGPLGQLQPYVLTGVGRSHISFKNAPSTSDTTINLGGGVQFPLNPQWNLRTELRLVHNSDRSLTNYLLMAGAQYHFGSLAEDMPVDDNSYQPAPVQPIPLSYVPADSDGDGVVDANDRCPNTPAGWEVGTDGCPLDSDKDKVPNSIDECPNTPFGLPVGANGCPMDDDRDGVINANDKCPGTPVNEVVDEKGCTKVVEKVLTKKIEEQINIVFDSGQAVIKPQFESEVAKIADLAKQYPNATITIEGHTDASGRPDKNLLLSQQRADAVRMMLINKFSVDGGRLVAKGFGQTRPVADNTTAEGKAKNRRVVAVLTAESTTVTVQPVLKQPVAKAKKAGKKGGKKGAAAKAPAKKAAAKKK